MTQRPDAVADADGWLAGAPIERSGVLFVVGLGGGQLLTALDRRGWKGRVVALEPAETRTGVAAPGVTVLRGPAYDGLDRVVLDVDPDVEQPVIVGDPALMRRRRDEVVRATRLVMKAWFGARANQEARRRFAGPYLLNTLRNLAAIAAGRDAGVLAGAFAGVPAIVVAAGPSLDAALPDIAAARDRALILAVDTAARPLLGAGIAPDLIVALDPSEANATHLDDLPPCPATPLVAEGSLDPTALAGFRGRTLFFRVADHHPWPWLRQIGLDRQPLRAWGSVLTTAFDLALTMGADPIVFVGADLAFTAGRPYARGTTFEEEWRRALAWGQSLTSSWAERVAAWPETLESGVDGGSVRTAPHLQAFRDWIAAEAARAIGRRVVNATGAGILMGEALHQQSIAATLAACAPLGADVRVRLVQLTRRVAGPDGGVVPVPSVDLVQTWATWGGVTGEAIRAALDARPTALAPPSLAPAPPTDDAPAPADPDTAYLAELSTTASVRRLTLSRPDQDLLGDLRRLTADLTGNDAVVVVDDLDLGMGLQVRGAVDALLCERPDLWLEYRRFVDHRSRLTVLRGDAARHAPSPSEADADKWDAAHRDVAARLAPHIVRELCPTSVVDVGCGAGYWLDALRALGVADVHGVSARTTPLDAWSPPPRRFDVCLCLEVVSRLPLPAQEAVIAACVQTSDVVLFSSRLPGQPGGSPHDRPLPYWAAAFWRHGYVLDDRLRQAIERHTPFPVTVYDVLLVFRRRLVPAPAGETPSEAQRLLGEVSLASAARLHDLYTQKLWWAAAAMERETAAAPTEERPRTELVLWTVPPGRLAAAPDGARVVRLRTEAARWYVTHHGAALRVYEDDRPLTASPYASFSSASGGAWARWRDEILIRASDGSDPRQNGRRYGLAVPTHVAWAERQPLADILANGL